MLTDRQIQAAIKTKTTGFLNVDSNGKGSGSLVLIFRNGKASWFGRWTEQGKQRKKRLGGYPEVSLRDARERYAAEISAILLGGRNPKAVVTRTEKPTVELMFKSYVASLRSAGKVSADEFERALLTGKFNAADALGRHRDASAVDPADVSAYLAKAYRRGSRVSADRTRTYMAAAFSWAIKSTHDYTTENRQDWGIKANPVTMVKKDSQATKARERNLSAAEIKAFWAALHQGGFYPETAAAIKLVLCCGQRLQETLRVEGREVDLVGKVWNMPAHKTKGRKDPHTIPLPDMAVQIFQQLVAVHGDGNLFPSRTDKTKLMAITAPNKAIRRWCDATGFTVFQPRDLRRTWKSRTADAGIDRFTRDLIQQHAKGDTGSKHYDRADYLPQMREAMKKWNEWLVKTV